MLNLRADATGFLRRRFAHKRGSSGQSPGDKAHFATLRRTRRNIIQITCAQAFHRYRIEFTYCTAASAV